MNAVIATLLIAMAPVSELRGAIPFGVAGGLNPVLVYLVAVLGNLLPILPLMWFLRHGSDWAMERSAIVRRVLGWVFERTRRHHGHTFETFGFWALVVFVAVPLPLTGAWTGAVIAYLVDMPLQKAFFAILMGVLAAGLLVMAATLGIIHFIV